MDQSFDAVIVGAGQAAALAGRLTNAGWSVALVEKKWLGGTCVNVGCTPTKAMVASAKAAYTAAQGEKFGVIGGDGARVDLKRVKARKDAIVANFRTTQRSSHRELGRLHPVPRNRSFRNRRSHTRRGRRAYLQAHLPQCGSSPARSENARH